MKRLLMQLSILIYGGRLVWLKDDDGEVAMSIARVDPWGDMYADRWWPSRQRIVKLMPEGNVVGSYVVQWKFVE